MLEDLGGNHKRLFGIHPQLGLECRELVGTQSRAVNLAGVLLVGGGPPDDGLYNDEGGALCVRLGPVNGCKQGIYVLRVIRG